MAGKSFLTVGIIILLLLSLSSFEIVWDGRTEIFKPREKKMYQDFKKKKCIRKIVIHHRTIRAKDYQILIIDNRKLWKGNICSIRININPRVSNLDEIIIVNSCSMKNQVRRLKALIIITEGRLWK
ncbi:conserved hypothetical protein [Ricinus communis]|uniref:Uncharacterized protein n=1 Tax=Ricinus communis TaxID=3988 RepID=B9S786_RICCO|nr:conserved hypothetical protein [Ricinus communis]